MIYATTSDGGILIGLSEGNLTKLREGKPILKREPGMKPLRIFYGETDEALLQVLIDEGVLAKDVLIKPLGSGH